MLNLQTFLSIAVIILPHIFNIGTVIIIDVYLNLFKVSTFFAYYSFFYLTFSFWDYFFLSEVCCLEDIWGEILLLVNFKLRKVLFQPILGRQLL